MTPTDRILRVLIVDDSAMVRRVLAMGIERDPLLEVVGFASNGEQAQDLMRRLRPDVITLDLEMPNMDGLTFMRSYMGTAPIPTVVISSTTSGNSNVALQAVEAGAVDIISKPSGGSNAGLASMMLDICERIRAASTARPGLDRPRLERMDGAATSELEIPLVKAKNWLFAIGASTGGIQALTAILPQFPKAAPGIVIVQHMPQGFTASFAKRLNAICPMEVSEAVDGDIVEQGRILIAPGGAQHMVVMRYGKQFRVSLIPGDPVCFSRPSVDVLFSSVAREAGRNVSAAILTGMGRDGAEGMLAIRKAGGATFAQDEKTSVVYGMPQAAEKIGAAEQLVPLDGIPMKMTQAMKHVAKAKHREF